MSSQAGGTLLAADSFAKEHDPGPGHPESPHRFDAALRGVEGLGLARLPPRRATEQEIALVHSTVYIQKAKIEIARGARELSTGDTNVGPHSFEAALHAAGAAFNAVEAVMTGQARNAFCIVRPPGHHATPNRGMGFCIFNNVALAARYAQSKHGAKRVVIADWDVHHGNGTQDTFYSDGSVLFFSTHQFPWYPGTGSAAERGEGPGEGKIINCPFPAGAGRAEILGAFENRLMPAVDDFRPDLVLISAGFDSRLGDPLGQFRLSDADFADLTHLMRGAAERHCGGRLVSLLEGGYDLHGLQQAIHFHVTALL